MAATMLPSYEPTVKRQKFEEWSSSSGSSPAHSEDGDSSHMKYGPSVGLGPSIEPEACFSSYLEFEETFEAWKRKFLHPFRVASSEILKDPDGTMNAKFKYRYVVYHCAHYGEPRMRGIGKRPNQNYLPCGCQAMLRVNYNFTERCLKITTLNIEHKNHELTMDVFTKVATKINRRSYAMSPYNPQIKTEVPSPQSDRDSLLEIQLKQLKEQQHMVTNLFSAQKENTIYSSPTYQPHYNQHSVLANLMNMVNMQLFPTTGQTAPLPAPADPLPTDTLVIGGHHPAPPPNLPAPVAMHQTTVEDSKSDICQILSAEPVNPPVRAELLLLIDEMRNSCQTVSEDIARLRCDQIRALRNLWVLPHNA